MVPVHYFASQSRNGAEQGRVCFFFFFSYGANFLRKLEPGRPSDYEGKKMQSGLQAQTHEI